MENTHKKQNTTDLAALLVFTVFALCVLLVLLTGADLYRKLTLRDQRSYALRTAAQYITTRVRQANQLDGVTVEDFHGISSLVLREQIDGEWYETRVYCYEGYIRELFSSADSGLGPEDGEKLLLADALTFQLAGQILSAQIICSDGSVQPLTLFLRCGKGAEP